MWHLIVPPILVVAVAAVLAWYLSRKATDPDVAAKVAAVRSGVSSDAKARELSRREFVLKLRERMASFFKVSALRVHNYFQSSTEEIRANRMKIREMRQVTENISQSVSSRLSGMQKSTFTRLFGFRSVRRKSDESGAAESVNAPVGSEPAGPSAEPPVQAEPQPAVLPPVMPRRAEPKPIIRRPRIEKWKEEEFINRIAGNPKDLAAYEGLGDYYFGIGNLTDAKECYRQVLKLQPTNRGVKLKIRRLEKHFEKGGN